jgi:hypothetical protein
VKFALGTAIPSRAYQSAGQARRRCARGAAKSSFWFASAPAPLQRAERRPTGSQNRFFGRDRDDATLSSVRLRPHNRDHLTVTCKVAEIEVSSMSAKPQTIAILDPNAVARGTCLRTSTWNRRPAYSSLLIPGVSRRDRASAHWLISMSGISKGDIANV